MTTDTLVSECRTAGRHVVGLDAGHGVDAYGFKIWELVGKHARTGSGVPCVIIWSSDGSQSTQFEFLTESKALVEDVVRGLFPSDPDWSWIPSAASIDKDIKSLLALRRVWPNIMIIYCLFHLCQWLYPILRTAALGVPDDKVDDVAFQFRSLANLPTKALFDARWTELRAEWGQLYPSFLIILIKALFNDHWKTTWPIFYLIEVFVLCLY